MTGYALSHRWHDFVFRNQSLIKPQHGVLYYWLTEFASRDDFPERFEMAPQYAMTATGMRHYNTYKDTLSDLQEWGFVLIRSKGVNQYQPWIFSLTDVDYTLLGQFGERNDSGPNVRLKKVDRSKEPKRTSVKVLPMPTSTSIGIQYATASSQGISLGASPALSHVVSPALIRRDNPSDTPTPLYTNTTNPDRNGQVKEEKKDDVVVDSSGTPEDSLRKGSSEQTPSTTDDFLSDPLVIKIQQCRDTMLRPSAWTYKHCLAKHKINEAHYLRLTNAFFDNELSDYEAGKTPDFSDVGKHLRSWIGIHIREGIKSAYHPSKHAVKNQPTQPGQPRGSMMYTPDPSTKFEDYTDQPF